MINSCRKGKQNERDQANYLKRFGFTSAKRGQQRRGSPDSPDLVVEELPDVHFEAKSRKDMHMGNAEWLAAIAQAKRDCGHKHPVVLWREYRRKGFRLTDAVTGATYCRDEDISRVLRGLQSQADVDREIRKATGDTQ